MNQKKTPVSKNIDENVKGLKQILSNCDDVKFREMRIGKQRKIKCQRQTLRTTSNSPWMVIPQLS